MKENAKLFIVAGLLLATGLALLVSPFASGSPDGLNRVAVDQGFDGSATEHALDDSPVAGYSVRGIDDAKVGKGLSGLIGVLLTFGVALAAFAALRSFRSSQRPDPTEGRL
jgi:PDGLE domain